MIKVTSYRGHIRNWENLCRELSIDLGLSREERENEILIKPITIEEKPAVDQEEKK